MYSVHFIPKWLTLSHLIWIITTFLSHDFTVEAYSTFTPIKGSNGYLDILNTGGVVGGSSSNFDASTTPQYNLRYAITENQPIKFKIGKINEDLLQTPEIRSTRLFTMLQPLKHASLYYRLREPSNYFDLNETTSILFTKKLIDLEELCPRYCKENTFHAQLNIHVNIWANYQLICVVNAEITVTDIDDNLPTFPSTVSRPYTLRLKEVIYRAGKHVELPKAIDKDIQPNHAEIAYRLDSHPEDRFNSLEAFRLVVRNDSRLVLVLQKDLDYESVKEYRFYLVCSSPYINAEHNSDLSTTEDRLETIIEVLNINDIEPTFSQAVYEVKVEENVPVNSTVYELKATDKDVNSTITYTMENGVDLNATMKFLIESNGKVIVQEQLDYEECNSYSFTVRASDGEFFALAKLIVIIVDVNDEPPEYVLNPNPLVIMENKPARTLIGHLLVIDRDSPEVNGQVQCEEPPDLRRKQPILFVQDSIYLNQRSMSASPSSALQETSHTDTDYLPVNPSISSSSETHVYQRFTLYNRNEFDRENGPETYEAIIHCWDGVTTASFSSGPQNSFMHMEPYLSANYSVSSLRKPPSLTATMTITLQILDANDNEPDFEKQFYKSEVKENSPIGTKIMRMHATDKDIGVNAQIYYTLEKNEMTTPYFKIDPVTGWITNSAELDREVQATFQLTVLATDGGFDSGLDSRVLRPPGSTIIHHTATTQLLIQLLDENDNTPEFRGPRQFAVEENQQPNKWIGDIQVLDRDEGVNSAVTFRLLTGKLLKSSHSNNNNNNNDNNNSGRKEDVKKVNQNVAALEDDSLPIKLLNNGSLYTTKSLDREYKSHYCFEVVVSDKGLEKSHSTVDTICVRVLDMNDNKPYFVEIKGANQFNNETLLLNGSISETLSHTVQSNSLKQNYLLKNTSKYPVVHISYNEVPGYCAMVAKALDDDEGRNAQLRYGISRKYLHKTQRGRGEKEDKTANILDAFTMDPPSGRVMLTRNLNVNELGLYELVLTVEDNGEQIQRAEKTIQLLVEDTPPRGNWLFPEIEQSHDLSSLFSTKYAITETHTILVVIILSGISAFLASVLISAILCMIKPCKKSNSVNRLNKNSCTKKCIINSNENNGIISFNKDYNASMYGDYDLNKMPMDQSNMLSYDDYNLNLLSHHHQHHHDQQFQSSSFTTENDGTLLDPTFSPFHQYHHHHHPDSIVISGDSTTLSGIDNYYLPPYKLPGIDNYIGNSTNTSNNVTTTTTTPTATAANIPTACINRMDGGKQEEEEEEKLHLMKRTTSPCVQRTSPPVSLLQYTTQQPKWSYLQFQFPHNDCQQIMPNISCNMSPRCSTYSPQHINTYNPVSQTSRQSVISPSLVSTQNFTAVASASAAAAATGPDLLLFQCPRSSPLSSVYCYHSQKKTNSMSPNHHLSNVSTVFDLGLNSPIHSNLMQHNNNPISIDCTVKDSPHSVQIIGEEQRSDSGRGASDEENSNQVQMNNNTTVSPVNSSSSTAASDMFQGNGLKASVVNQKASSNQKFRSNTLKCYTDNSSNITTGLIYPSLPRVNMCKTSSDNQELGTFQRKPFSLTTWKDAYSTKE